MALWRASRAVLGRGPGRKAASRALDGGRAVFLRLRLLGTAVYASGGGQGSSSNEQSQDGTSSALKLPFGQVLVSAAGCVLIGVGVVFAAAGILILVAAVRFDPDEASARYRRL
ncbi:DUF1206 domain-containing protein [Streptomyces sp. NPDC092369]|uniref:DUF1206 domain-containing protein n=1 Tax=Streptomyces sp. NPDC092369 TaxID=3366015 RepID=UPI00382FE1B2